MRYVFLIPFLCLLAACDAGFDAQNSGNQAKKAVYQCDGTLTLAVVFSNEHAQVTLPDGDAIELPIAVSGSGFRYATPRHELRGKGDEAIWTVGRRAPIRCRVQEK